MRTLFSLRRNRASHIATENTGVYETASQAGRRYATVLTANELLSDETNSRLLSAIKRSVSVTNEAWENHYRFAVARFAEIVQALPASRNHHHSNAGGLLTHTLEVLLSSLRLSSGVILPPGAEPEDILHHAERWRFGIFISALLHDVGKIICDQEIVYRTKGEEFISWQPWHGPMPIGAEYAHRYRNTRAEHVHGLHEKVGVTLLPYLLTHSASNWLTNDKALLGQMMNTLTASATGSGVVGEVIRKADRSSTAENLSPATGVSEDGAKPLHVKILETLQALANEGKMKRNMPGASCWVTENLTYVVAKSTMEKVREHLLAGGHKGIPQSPLRLMQILTEHKIALPAANSEIHQAIIKDEQRSWEQKLSFLIIPNEHIWISGLPNTFNGTITPVDSKGNEIELPGIESNSDLPERSPADPLITHTTDSEAPQSPNDKAVNNQQTPKSPAITKDNAIGDVSPVAATAAPEANSAQPEHVITSISQNRIEAPNSRNLQSESITGPDVPEHSAISSERKPVIKTSGKSALLATPKVGGNSKPSTLKQQHEFFTWLVNGVRYRRIRSNESGASVHIIDGFVALITPKIFDLYLDDNKAQAIALGRNRDIQLSKLQREIKSLSVHHRLPGGEDFHKLIVRGPKRQSTITAMLFARALIPEFDSFSPNPILISGETQ